MLIKDKGHFIKGILLAVTFLVVLFIMFSPFFNGENALRASDRLFNSIAKGSTYYMPGLQKKTQAYVGKTIDISIKFKTQDMAQKAAKILTVAGADVKATGEQLQVKCDLGRTALAALKDSDEMFKNQEAGLVSRYGFGGKEAMFVWWTAFNQFDKALGKQKLFKEADFLGTIVKKGVEVGYNFYGIEPESASSKMGVLAFSLVFYVVYTLWWGIAILFLFEGIGLEMKAGAKKEV